jgi:cell division protease FtsH
MKNKDFSDNVASAIDNEVRKIILSSYETAKKVISENRELLDTIANYLVEIETITRADIEEISLTGKIAWWEKEKVEAAEAKIKKEQEDLKKKEEKPAEPETKIEDENKGENQ